MRRSAFHTSLGAAAILAAAHPAFGQIQARAEPSRQSIDAKVGEPIARDVAVTNSGQLPVVVRVHLSDWTIDDRGQMALRPPGTLPATLEGCMRFEPQTFSLAPGETGRVHVVLTLPADGPATRWGVLLSEIRPAVLPTGHGPRAIAELGSTFYLSRIDPQRITPELTSLDVVPVGVDSVTVRARVRNMGERHFYVSGDVSLADSSGAVVQTGKLQTGVVLPGTEREFTWMCDARLAPGTYAAIATLDTGQPELLVGETRVALPLGRSLALPLATR
jgi:P pilus assembly chaperone PapD